MTQWNIDLLDIRWTYQGHAGAYNIVLRLPGPEGDSRHVRSPDGAVSIFFTDSELEKVVFIKT